jgi:2-oxoisovalerate dehydrogenase E2 component (dihydrolipoyl transacylase)
MADEKDFLLPDLGEGLTEGEVVRWLVAVGDTVVVDQPVAEVETAKAVVEVPCPWAGTVTKLHAGEGEEVEVGKPLISIDLDAGAAPAPPAADAEPQEAAEAPDGEPGTVAQDAAAGDLVPESKEEADDASGNVLVGYGTGARKSRRRRGARPGGATAPPSDGPPARPRAKPPVRKFAKDLGVDLAEVPGSGPEGTITREDVQAFVEGDGRAAAPAPSPTAQVAAAPGEERIPVRGVRKTIAEKMTLSRREIPEATTWVDCDATALWELRRQLDAAQPDVKVSPLAIIMRICVVGLQRFREVNARLDTETKEIVLQQAVHLGFATHTENGLMVPVIHDAHAKTTFELATELDRLARAARDRSIKPEELSGGTFTISNYGSFGVDGGSAVINHPEAAILGIGRIHDRPWVHDGDMKVRKVMQLSIAFDHRICDGGEAAGFLRFVADCAENPAVLLGNL